MVPRRRTRVAPPACPLMTCMKVIGGAWTPNVVWYLREAPRRFSELKNDLQGVSGKTLSARLTSPPTVEYRLTPLGARLIPAVEAIVDVGNELKRLRRLR